MSKKVAQLTKVIYHLNTKNEDHDLDMQDLAEQYEAELELVLKDTTEKVNFFKSKMEEASDEKRVREVARALEIKYEEEKRKCLNELDAIRKRAADREAAVQKAATKNIDSLSMQGLEQQIEQLIRSLGDTQTARNAQQREWEAKLKGMQEDAQALESSWKSKVRGSNGQTENGLRTNCHRPPLSRLG
ncbi:hypothetical protein DUNSADRAFT_5586 [Dunaliella salina]|nr:hypothetical protein DUNSADRAFT_5586 [Dunaliella salina]|eukprot:KAF5825979.1 hypothetical protein DUNSADRAFT_5586 [Dunaliella salina]